MVRIGDKAPEFTLKGVSQGHVSDYSIQDYKGKWLVLFFYPADFTFICPTEVSGFSKLARELRSEEAEILGVSVDSVSSHIKWSDELGGIDYPLLSDDDKTVSRLYDVLDEKEGVCLRATFIINPTGEISYLIISHTNVGRSVQETLRVLEALRSGRLCPSDWHPGEPTGDLNLKY
jgi:alkyl hydroperoxide reductase subunit AhpC